MAATITLRAARRSDAAELAVLVDIASHSFAAWIWYGGVLAGTTDTAMEHGRNRLRRDGEAGNWQDAVIAEIGDETAATAIGYRLDDGVRDATAPHPVLQPLVELQRPLAGHWFVDSVGVYRHHRRRGVARQLMADQIARAGGAAVSLITESHNEAAQTLYRGLGFAEAARREAVPLYENSRSHEWVLMTRTAA